MLSFLWNENNVWNNVSIINGKENIRNLKKVVNNVKKERKIRIKCQLLLLL